MKNQEKIEQSTVSKFKINVKNDEIIARLKKTFKHHVAGLLTAQNVQEQVKKFDRKALFDSIKLGTCYGKPNSFSIKTSWPSCGELKTKRDNVLQGLRIAQVEWAMCDGIISDLRVSLNDGSASPMLLRS